jgi:hypothetical protein
MINVLGDQGRHGDYGQCNADGSKDSFVFCFLCGDSFPFFRAFVTVPYYTVYTVVLSEQHCTT